jgi:hypothetical protein
MPESSPERGSPLLHGGDLGLPREHLSGEYAVHLRIPVQAAVGQHGEPEVQVGGLAESAAVYAVPVASVPKALLRGLTSGCPARKPITT